jgi:biopolymer transport protein ExbD
MLRLSKRSVEPVPLDIAPLIDVVFLLLLFFALTSSVVLSPGIRVALPKAATGKTLGASHVVITLTKEHVVYWEEEPVTLAALRQRLRQPGGQQPILIRADRHAYVDRLVELWDLCRDAGVREIHIATISE